jgi:hypothetical protein
MREDMEKVLCERPRIGGWGGMKGYKKRCYKEKEAEIERKFESIKKPWLDRKNFTDLISPLYNFIDSKVGCLWDEVYSEIRERVNPNSLQQIHLLDHIKDMVERNVVMVNNEPYICGSRYTENGYFRLLSSGYVNYYYVHPVDGILRKAPFVSHKKKKEKKKYIWIDEMNQYRLILCKNQWIWFHVSLAPLKSYVFPLYNRGYDQVLRRIITETEAYGLYNKKVYAVSKRQLNKREIKSLQVDLL